MTACVRAYVQERLARIDQEVVEEEERQKMESEMKRQKIDEAERRRHDNRDINDADLIDDMFRDIIGESPGDTGGKGPSAFSVRSACHRQNVSMRPTGTPTSVHNDCQDELAFTLMT